MTVRVTRTHTPKSEEATGTPYMVCQIRSREVGTRESVLNLWR